MQSAEIPTVEMPRVNLGGHLATAAMLCDAVGAHDSARATSFDSIVQKQNGLHQRARSESCAPAAVSRCTMNSETNWISP